MHQSSRSLRSLAASSLTPTVGAVIVTYRRPHELANTLAAVVGQPAPPTLTVVVDNDGPIGSTEVASIVTGFGPRVVHLPSGGNVGYGAGLAVGMRFLQAELDPDYYWTLDDDSPPSATALSSSARCLRALVAGCGRGRRSWRAAPPRLDPSRSP